MCEHRVGKAEHIDRVGALNRGIAWQLVIVGEATEKIGRYCVASRREASVAYTDSWTEGTTLDLWTRWVAWLDTYVKNPPKK